LHGPLAKLRRLVRSPPCFIGGVLCAGALGQLLPDMVDHGHLMPGREAHLPLFWSGVLIIVLTVLWIGTYWALLRRLRVHSELEMVK
jgi:hypothetical protein